MRTLLCLLILAASLAAQFRPHTTKPLVISGGIQQPAPPGLVGWQVRFWCGPAFYELNPAGPTMILILQAGTLAQHTSLGPFYGTTVLFPWMNAPPWIANCPSSDVRMAVQIDLPPGVTMNVQAAILNDYGGGRWHAWLTNVTSVT